MTSLLRRRTSLAALAGLSCVGLVACTQAPVQSAASNPTSDTSQSSDGQTTTASDTASPRDTATGFGTLTTTTTASKSPTAIASVSSLPSTSGSATSPAGDPNACTAGALKVTVERGSGTNGHQYATLRFTNSSTTKCNLTGFPDVHLLLDGATIGTTAEHSDKAATTVSIQPGRSAVAALTNDSTCNALNSNQVSVMPPNTSTATLQPLTFRACTLTVDPVSTG